MIDLSQIRRIVDSAGNTESLVVPVDIWNALEPYIKRLSVTEGGPAPLVQRDGALRDFADLMQCWDFSYAYDPSVQCPHCGRSTTDWQKDPEHTFVLTAANIGGLLVFHCQHCNTTIRHKHFKDHVAVEYDTPKPRK